MYERFYNLRERPFALSPDPDYLYPSRIHREALSYLQYGIQSHAGFIVMTGEIGCGKTTLLQAVVRGLDRQTSISRLVSTMLDARELVEAVMLDFGLEPDSSHSKPHLLRDLARHLVDQRTAGRLALLLIDEAQNLSLPALEEVRMLSNLETEKSKLIHIVLVGQPNLRDLLAQPPLEQLRQRVTVSYHIQPLDADETFAYINHRLRRAAIGAPLEFPRDVTEIIHRHSGGVGRRINVIADAILLYGYGGDRAVVDVDLTREALRELASTGVIADPSSEAPGEAPARSVAIGTPRHAEPDLAAREARLEEQERRLAEQQRILIEGYRLLRSHHDRPIAPPAALSPPPPRPAGPPATPEAAPVSPDAPAGPLRPAALAARPLFQYTETPGFWSRVRRNLFGVSRPVFED
jgi:general secretion pathway protein A